jgi:hypothetical protein
MATARCVERQLPRSLPIAVDHQPLPTAQPVRTVRESSPMLRDQQFDKQDTRVVGACDEPRIAHTTYKTCIRRRTPALGLLSLALQVS